MQAVTHSNLQEREQMEKKSSTKSSIRFAFSWADEVEREEQQQLQQQQQKEQKANPFGAGRPREVVLAEKGVDWRARDRELDTPHHNARTSVPRKRGARAPPRGIEDNSTPTVSKNGSGNCNGWTSKRKFVGKGSPSARQIRSVAYQGRRVFGELNIEGSSSCWSSKNYNLIARNKVESCEYNDSSASMISSIKFGESGVTQKRRVKGKGRKGEVKKSKKQN